MFFDRTKILSVYLSCGLLFGAVLLLGDGNNLEQIFLKPLDSTYSILGSRSVFKDYLGSNKVYAFLPYWNLDGRDLNLQSITDLSYFGLNVGSNSRINKEDGLYKKWRQDKDLAKIIKTMKSSGGSVSITLICQVDEDIDSILSCKDCWKDLASDVEEELRWAGIKDINFDFEYSGYTTPENAQSYSDLVGYVNSHLDSVFGESFVTVSTYADSVERSEKNEVRVTNPKSLAQNSDALFIMAYDFHRPTSSNAGPVSPLDGSYTTTRLNLIKMLDTYLAAVPASQLILGLPFYGYDWVVADTSPMSSRIEGNDFIGYSKVKTYAEVVDLLVKKRLAPLWDEAAKTPYINYIDEETGALRQIYYDNEKSLLYKTSLARTNNLLGVGVWALGYEGGYVDLWKSFKFRP